MREKSSKDLHLDLRDAPGTGQPLQRETERKDTRTGLTISREGSYRERNAKRWVKPSVCAEDVRSKAQQSVSTASLEHSTGSVRVWTAPQPIRC